MQGGGKRLGSPRQQWAAVQIFQSASSHSVCAAFDEVGEVGFGREGTQEISVE